MKAKVYLSDEGYGHIVRQRAIMTELHELQSPIAFTLQTHRHMAFAKQNTPATTYIDRYNNISWHKNEDSSPDIEAIRKHYQGYLDRLPEFLEEEQTAFDYDFVLSDFVYEGFDLADRHSIPSFGVAHFTWDWFFSKIYPRVLSDSLFKYFTEAANKANKLYFPPFTPNEILKFYASKAVEVPFIVKQDVRHKSWLETNRVKILVMDSGAGLMANSIRESREGLDTSDWIFGVQEELGLKGDNFFNVPSGDLLIDYVQNADLVVGRPGFNTLSECIAYRKPMLLISESMNPEMDFNIAELKKLRLGAFMSANDFRNNFIAVLDSFFKYEFTMIQETMKNHSFATNGAQVIAKDLLSSL
ncbi:MAG: hypothetical protein Salg2KO_12990 [Salibacteraceae bacterium]